MSTITATKRPRPVANRNLKRMAAVGAAGLLATTLGACRYTGFDDVPSRDAAAAATTWLTSQQQSDGGFEVAAYPGFETPDAIVAIAENAQTSGSWDSSLALAAVQGTLKNGLNPLDAMDDYADTAITGAVAAKLTVLVALPLGLDPTAFDPQSDGARDLVATMDAALLPTGSYGTFNGTLFAAIAKKAAGGTVPTVTRNFIVNGQKANGSWDFMGSPTGSGTDVDTTALALEALVSAGLRSNNPTVAAGLAFLANAQQASGAWQSYGSDDPNSTAMAIMAITGAGFQPTGACWRDTFAPALAGQPYASPLTWLAAQKAGDGHIASPNDSWGVNTFATSQSIQAFRRTWMPANAIFDGAC